jgi:hypothetical protein
MALNGQWQAEQSIDEQSRLPVRFKFLLWRVLKTATVMYIYVRMKFTDRLGVIRIFRGGGKHHDADTAEITNRQVVSSTV